MAPVTCGDHEDEREADSMECWSPYHVEMGIEDPTGSRLNGMFRTAVARAMLMTAAEPGRGASPMPRPEVLDCPRGRVRADLPASRPGPVLEDPLRAWPGWRPLPPGQPVYAEFRCRCRSPCSATPAPYRLRRRTLRRSWTCPTRDLAHSLGLRRHDTPAKAMFARISEHRTDRPGERRSCSILTGWRSNVDFHPQGPGGVAATARTSCRG